LISSGSVASSSNTDSYGSPASPAVSSFESASGIIESNSASDSYGIPALAPVISNSFGVDAVASGSDSDSYGTPASPAVNSFESVLGVIESDSASDSYGNPALAPVSETSFGVEAIDSSTDSDSYGTPASPAVSSFESASGVIESNSASDSYGTLALTPVSDNTLGTSDSNSDSYGTPQSSPVSTKVDSNGTPSSSPAESVQSNSESYGSPASNPISSSVSQAEILEEAEDSYSSSVALKDDLKSGGNNDEYGLPIIDNSVSVDLRDDLVRESVPDLNREASDSYGINEASEDDFLPAVYQPQANIPVNDYYSSSEPDLDDLPTLYRSQAVSDISAESYGSPQAEVGSLIDLRTTNEEASELYGIPLDDADSIEALYGAPSSESQSTIFIDIASPVDTYGGGEIENDVGPDLTSLDISSLYNSPVGSDEQASYNSVNQE